MITYFLRIVTKGNTRKITLRVGFITIKSYFSQTELTPKTVVHFLFYTNLRILAFKLTITNKGGRVGTRLCNEKKPSEFFLFGCQLRACPRMLDPVC